MLRDLTRALSIDRRHRHGRRRQPCTGPPGVPTDRCCPVRPGPWQACSSPWDNPGRRPRRAGRTSDRGGPARSCPRRTGHHLVRRPARARPTACHPGQCSPSCRSERSPRRRLPVNRPTQRGPAGGDRRPRFGRARRGALKPLVHRTYLGVLAYPSGHTTAAFALAAVVTILLLRPASPPKARRARAVVSFAGCLVGKPRGRSRDRLAMALPHRHRRRCRRRDRHGLRARLGSGPLAQPLEQTCMTGRVQPCPGASGRPRGRSRGVRGRRRGRRRDHGTRCARDHPSPLVKVPYRTRRESTPVTLHRPRRGRA